MRWSHSWRTPAGLAVGMAFGLSAADGPLKPDQALWAFRLEPGRRIDLVAAEPTVADPVAMAFDEHGRLFVVENRGYPSSFEPGRAPEGAVVVLEDRNGDGVFEKRTVFADRLTAPSGVSPWRGGVIVTCAPEILYLRDQDGDGRAEERRVLLTGFEAVDPSKVVNRPVLGPDGWIYVASGGAGGTIRVPGETSLTPLELSGDLRFLPDRGRFETVAGRAGFGQAFDDAGRRFICTSRVHVQHVVASSSDFARNPGLRRDRVVQDCPEVLLPEPLRGFGRAAPVYPVSSNYTVVEAEAGTFTSACGILIYRSTGLPAEFQGNVFACEPAGNLVHRDQLIAAGATFIARRAAGTNEFLVSTDNWFRPVFLSEGPDGALYICDLYRRTIAPPQSWPESIRKRTDFDAGKGLGRIYRVAATRRKPARSKIDLAQASADRLVTALAHPDAWWRDTARRLLIEREDRSSVAPLRTAVASTSRPGGGTDLLTMQALQTLAALGAADEGLIQLMLKHPSAVVREVAARIAAPLVGAAAVKGPAATADWVRALEPLAADPDARVRFQCALTLGATADSATEAALIRIALRDAADPWARAAVLGSLAARSPAFARELVAQTRNDRGAISATEPLSALLSELGVTLGRQLSPQQLAALVKESANAASGDATTGWLPLMGGVAQSLAEPGSAGRLTLRQLAGTDALKAAFDGLVKLALKIVIDPLQSPTLRVSAIHLLGESDFATAGEALSGLLAATQPVELQRVAAAVLGRMPDPAVETALLHPDRWRAYSPPLREAVVLAFLNNPRHLPWLLTALESEQVQLWALTLDQRAQLLQHPDAAIRRRTEGLIRRLQAGERMKAFEQSKSVLELKADAVKGRPLFKQHCGTCHRVNQEGVAVGPDLYRMRMQSKETMLLHTLLPEYEILPESTGYVVETKDDRTLTALIIGETATSVTLRQSQGEQETLARDQITRLVSSTLSLMPSELEKNMSAQDLADLLAYAMGE